MIRFEHLFFCMVITLSVTTFILHWHTPDDKRKHVHLRTSVKMCELDATCDTLETCHHNMCVHFWPMSAMKTRACHLGCEQDIRLYEDHFYLQNITDVKPFEGISKDTCVISYRVVGTTPGLSVSEYERRKRGSVRRTERLDDVNVALCLKIEQQKFTRVKEKRPIDQQKFTRVKEKRPIEQQNSTKVKEKRPIERQKITRVNEKRPIEQHEMVVVTGANSGYFHALENFIGSMHFWEPTRQLVVYNLGLSASQIEQVKTWHNVHLEWPNGIPSTYAPHIHALKKYAWKPIAMLECTKKMFNILWLDAGSEVRGPLTDIESILNKDGVFLVQGQDADMTRWVHDGTLTYFNVERSVFSKKPSFSGNTQGWALNSGAYHQILEPLVECANKKECIDPVGASLRNHRYDQSALSVITYTSGMDIVPHTEFLAVSSSQLHADIKKPNKMCIWTARGHSSAYKQYTKHKEEPKTTLSSPQETVEKRTSDVVVAIASKKTDQITIKNNLGFNRDEPCDIPCHYTTSDEKVDATVYELRGRRAPPSGISVYMQMEGEHHYPIDTIGWTVENTYRWSSPLLKPYFEWVHYHGETDIQSKRVAQDAISGISFLARNCGSRNNREQVVKDLIQQVRVDAMSSCLHNHDKPPEDKNLPWIQNKIKLLRGWKFHAAFENGNVRDYVTEKVYTALAAGTVPIYMGAPNIDEFVPKGSIIRVDSFEDTAALAKHIQECLTNETLYQSYHDWRDRPLNSEFVEKFAFTNVTTECRTCRWVYAHKHGLPWDKKSQTFEMPEIKTEVQLPSLRHVDPFIGTATTGHTTPGAKAPFGMMYMVPVNSYDPMGSKWWEYTAGYQYSDKTFSGIAHTALTGTGIPGLLDVKISPFEKSRDKSNEIAHPGYYSVTVDGVNIAVIAGNRFGIHRYTGTSHLFLKSKGCVSTNAKNTITGSCSAYFNEKWEKQKYPYSVHFYIELPSGCTYEQQTMTCPGKNIEMKIAISYVDQNGAKANFKDENTDWKSLHKKTSTKWARLMDKIQVHGWHSEKQRKIFSSALYRTLLSPYTHNDADGRIRGPDGAIHTVDFTYYTFLSTWDTYRAWSSVIRLVRPDVLTDIAKTSVFHYKTMGIMPRWTVAGLDIQMMPGVPSMNVAFQAWRWGLTDSQLTKDIYEAMVGTLESKTKYKEGHLDAFVEKGVVPCGDKFQETVSQSLELGLNARCAAELAAHLHDSKESKWRHLSRAYRRHYDPDTKYLVGVNGANFCKPSSAYKVDANPELYTEGNAITWLWSAPFEGVKSLLGPELFKQRLHDLFTKSVGAVSKRDYSGLIGAYAHGNEPTHHVPFWFKQNGDEATTNKYVHQILDTLYLDTPDGLPGNDDAGQISAWYVLATMGIYPVDPLAKEFQTHEPRVQYAVLNEPSGLRHTLTPTSKKEHHVVKYTIPDSLKPYVTNHPEGGLFVKTGDIPEMWIRDSVAQVWPYRDSHPGMIAEVLYRQSEFILHDVYANSYNLKWQVSDKLNRHMQTLGRGEWVGTRNYELDSGCYFLRLLYHAWKKHQLEIKTFRPSVELLVETWQVEQYHEEQSPYRYPELKRNGLGTPVKWTGMTWTGFRPSDDPCTYGYHVPDNLFAAKALEYVSEMFPDIKEAKTLRQQILTGVQEHGTWTGSGGKKRYCYEVDGLGGCNKMDDANVPSLLSIPYLDPEGYDHVIWQNTYEWIWSSKNPYFFTGTAAAGIGSPHTPAQYIWPMSLVMRGLVDTTVAEEMRKQIEKTKVRGKLHESFHKDDPKRLTREDFSWPNELYKELKL